MDDDYEEDEKDAEDGYVDTHSMYLVNLSTINIAVRSEPARLFCLSGLLCDKNFIHHGKTWK